MPALKSQLVWSQLSLNIRLNIQISICHIAVQYLKLMSPVDQYLANSVSGLEDFIFARGY